MTDPTGKLTCDMTDTCTSPVTHLDHKGYIYCTPHGLVRRAHGINCRKLRPHELRRLERGDTIRRY